MLDGGKSKEMPKTIKSWLFIAYITVIAALLIGSFPGVHERKMRRAQIMREYNLTAEEYKKINNRPIPDSIYMLPYREITPTKNTKYDRSEEGHEIREADALKINKRDGVYYWDSNGGRPLTVVTKRGKMSENGFARKISTFTAGDGSGSIVIGHDGYELKGACHYPMGRNAQYIEYRLNEHRDFFGRPTFFPPRPNGWCKTLETRLNEEFN